MMEGSEGNERWKEGGGEREDRAFEKRVLGKGEKSGGEES